jgi:hypothetical protein
MHVLRRGFEWIAVICVNLFSCGFATGKEAAVKPIESAFDSRVVQLTAKPGEKAVTAGWTYTNHWDHPLLVEGFDQSCGCLSGEVAPSGHEAIAPGQSGTIRAQFTPGNHRGVLRKSLHVRFVGHEKPVELVVEATIPSSVELSTRELVWKKDAKPSPQIIDVTSGNGSEFTITGLLGVPETRFKINTETLTERRHYRVSIVPVGIPDDDIHTLQIRTDSADPRDRVLAVFLRTEAAPPASPSTPSDPSAQ